MPEARGVSLATALQLHPLALQLAAVVAGAAPHGA